MESRTYAELLASLPAGDFGGNGRTEFGVAKLPAVFIDPLLITIHSDEGVPQVPLVTLISARGATGKSVLAQHLSATKGVPLWRLDQDKGVSADALSSRLATYLATPDATTRFKMDPGAFVILDALDEARMRVSGTS